jgi:hypothetical protein
MIVCHQFSTREKLISCFMIVFEFQTDENLPIPPGSSSDDDDDFVDAEETTE